MAWSEERIPCCAREAWRALCTEGDASASDARVVFGHSCSLMNDKPQTDHVVSYMNVTASAVAIALVLEEE